MELLIGMIIGSIVIALGYSTYAIIYKQYLAYKTIKKQVVETMQLNTLINEDMINSNVVTYNDGKLILNKKNGVLEYRFNASYVTRRQHELTDTFKLGAVNLLPEFFNNKESNTPSLLTNFTFDVIVLGDTEHFTFTKNYSAETLMNYEIKTTQ